MLDRRYLTPTRRNDVSLAPVKLHIFLRRMVPRWNEAIRDVATVAFLDAAQSHRNIVTRQQGGPKVGRFVYSGADAKRCVDDHWLIDDPVGRSCIKAAIHAALARLSVLSHFLVLETPTVPSHYRLRFQLYARIASTVYMALRKKAGWPNFRMGVATLMRGPARCGRTSSSSWTAACPSTMTLRRASCSRTGRTQPVPPSQITAGRSCSRRQP